MSESASIVERWTLFDTWVDGFTIETFIGTMSSAIGCGTRTLILNHNCNSLARFDSDARFRSLYQQADYCFIDGTLVIALLRLSGRDVGHRNRMAVLDWMDPVFRVAEKSGWRITHVGADPGVMDRARSRILSDYPNLQLTLIGGFFDMEDGAANAAVVREVAESSPDLLLVGMGMPRQERWILDNYEWLKASVIVTVGGAFGYLGGSRRTPPRWLGPIGLEWLYRVATEPRRLWRRYFVEPLPLLPRVAGLVWNAIVRLPGRASER